MRSKPGFRRAAAVVAVLLAMAAPHTRASASVLEEAPLGVLAFAEEVSDDVLAGQRGRFVGQGRIVRFGIEMASTWLTAGGQLFSAGATLSVGLQQAQPQVRFAPRLTVIEPDAPRFAPGTSLVPSSARVSGGAGLANLSGVAQSIQVAGDGNAIANDAGVTVSTAAPPVAGGSGPTQVTQTTASGATVSAGLTGGGMTVGIRLPGVGETLQRIRGATGAGGAGVVQMVQTSGDLQRIQNHLNLSVQTDPSGSLRNLALQQSLSTMLGLRF